jgi:hypothetical protein
VCSYFFPLHAFLHISVRGIVTVTVLGSVVCRKFLLKFCSAFSTYEAVFSEVDCNRRDCHVELCKISCRPRLMNNVFQCPDITVYFHTNKTKLHLSTWECWGSLEVFSNVWKITHPPHPKTDYWAGGRRSGPQGLGTLVKGQRSGFITSLGRSFPNSANPLGLKRWI